MGTVGTVTSRFQPLAYESPELALLAAVVKVALEDAREGDDEAREWLASPACRATCWRGLSRTSVQENKDLTPEAKRERVRECGTVAGRLAEAAEGEDVHTLRVLRAELPSYLQSGSKPMRTVCRKRMKGN
jgi:hypothetical protein